MQLYVIRHGQTDYNAQRRFQGQADIPLNENGRDQARRAGAILSSLISQSSTVKGRHAQNPHVVSSDLLRTRETSTLVLEQIPEMNLAPVYDPRLREFHCGILENCTYDEFVLKHPDISTEYMNNFDLDSYNTRYPGTGGESRSDVMYRVGAALRETSMMIAGQRDCVWIAHGGVIDVLLELMHIQLPKAGNDRISAGNGDVMVFSKSEKKKLLSPVSEKLGLVECWSLEKHYKVGTAVAAKVVR